MSDDFELVEREPSLEEYRRLRASAGWSERTDAAMETSLANGLYAVCLVKDGETVGCGRVIGDGGMYFYIQDVIVLPELQGRGFGARIMEAVTAYLERAAPPGAFVGLMAAKGASGFYERYGFVRRADDAPGMFRYR